ncbi:hypothetical protein HR060_15260 [Catenovulum sp. SM1970]|uniref:hypothetical protein n=1 Tax=Marinifaba aquimaris TaxID=2741323 RepID=UPI001573FA1E|nr:hypothetical protein [Marinifaba aquimaris]NTS78209.1 hypothetical protein [Marinifaba aquimaris]
MNKTLVFKYIAVPILAIFLIALSMFLFAFVFSGDKIVQENPTIADDTNMFAKPTSICGCWYTAEFGKYKEIQGNTGCNILKMDIPNREELPRC